MNSIRDTEEKEEKEKDKRINIFKKIVNAVGEAIGQIIYKGPK